MIHSYPWYIRDWWLSDTRAVLTLEQRGLFRELLDLMVDLGGKLPLDEKYLQAKCAVTEKEWKRTWIIVSQHLESHPDGYTHPKVSEVVEKIEYFRSERATSGRIGGKKSAETRKQKQSTASSCAEASESSKTQAIRPSSTSTPASSTSTETRAYRESPSVVEPSEAGGVPPPRPDPPAAKVSLTRPVPEAERARITTLGWEHFSQAYPNKTGVEAACRWWISECTRCVSSEAVAAYVHAVMGGLERHLGPPVCAAWADRETGELRPEFVPPMNVFLGEKPWGKSRIAARLWQDSPPPWQPRGQPAAKDSATIAAARIYLRQSAAAGGGE